MTLIVIVIILVITLIAASIVWPGVMGAPWLPSTRRAVRKMLDLAQVQPGEVIYDLGCGDGRVLIAAARDFDARAVGVEIDLLRYLWARLRVKVLGLEDTVAVVWGNLFRQDLAAADVVIVYLRQDTNIQLMSKLWRELRPGTRVVSNSFIFPGWEVVAMDRDAQLFLYRVPTLHAGSWKVEAGS
jgi:SAM-dependent methyltransferase